jgi:hypothetical protein
MTGKSAATIDVSHAAGIVTITVQGRLTQEVGDEVVRRGRAAVQEHGARGLLHDFRRARLAETTLQLIRRMHFAREAGAPPHVRVAVLCAVCTPNYDFLATLLRNQGIAFQTFTDGAAALAWLAQL